MTERTLIIVKPDAMSKRISGKVIQALEEQGLQLVAGKLLQLSRPRAEDFYGEHKGKEFYEPLINFISSNPCLVTVWEGAGAIKKAREIIGATDPAQAKEGTIRKKYATDNRHNGVHGSDSAKSAEREIAFFFSDTEIFPWEEKVYKK
ncbi:MAG: nucleoside-diphosphate kinase [Elusimicrobia bacterium]|nr:nucleoside-diphosphate kinase [Elusimicrobiota bacterium]